MGKISEHRELKVACLINEVDLKPYGIKVGLVQRALRTLLLEMCCRWSGSINTAHSCPTSLSLYTCSSNDLRVPQEPMGMGQERCAGAALQASVEPGISKTSPSPASSPPPECRPLGRQQRMVERQCRTHMCSEASTLGREPSPSALLNARLPSCPPFPALEYNQHSDSTRKWGPTTAKTKQSSLGSGPL